MDLSTVIVTVFCLVDDRLKSPRRVRQCGPAPKLSDAEAITIEVVGEFLGLDSDEAIFRYFREHYGEWFPALHEVHRTTFARQTANLWKLKRKISGKSSSLSPLTTPLRHLRLDVAASVLVRPRLPLPPLPRRGCFR